MRRFRVALTTITMMFLAASALAQLVSPVPPKAPSTPEFVPPETAPPPPPVTTQPPPPPPEPDLPPIDLVKRDDAGKLIALTAPAGDAALEAMLPDLKTDELREKVRKLIDDRRAAVENLVARNAGLALAAREKLATLDDIKGYRELSAINSENMPLLLNPSIVDMAQQMQLLTPKETARAKKAADEYRKIMNRELQADIDSMVRANVRFLGLEPMRALDDLLLRLCGRWSDLRANVGVTDAQGSAIAASERAMTGAASDAARIGAMAAILKALSAQQQNMALELVARPNPELPIAAPPPVPKAKPAAPRKPAAGDGK